MFEVDLYIHIHGYYWHLDFLQKLNPNDWYDSLRMAQMVLPK